MKTAIRRNKMTSFGSKFFGLIRLDSYRALRKGPKLRDGRDFGPKKYLKEFSVTSWNGLKNAVDVGDGC